MFSSRFKWGFEKNGLASLIAEKRGAGASVLDLTESNPTRAGFDFPEAEILAALNDSDVLTYQPEARGSIVARQAVARYYHDCGLQVSLDSVHLTASTSEGYAFLFKLLADPGTEVLAPQPSYPLFEFLAALEDVELRPYNLAYTHPAGWRIDFPSLEAGLTDRTRAVIVVNPNNPTGSFVTAADRARLLEFCASKGLALISDEVFADFSWGEAMITNRSFVVQGEPLTFVLSGLSKIAGLPQMKLGWIVVGGPVDLVAAAQERLDLIADTYLSVGTPVQVAAPALLRLRSQVQDQIKDRVKDNLTDLARLADNSGCRLLAGDGGWYAVIEIPRHFSEEEWVLKLLAEDDVLVHPGYFFNFEREAFLILSLLTRRESFQEACRRLIARFQ